MIDGSNSKAHIDSLFDNKHFRKFWRIFLEEAKREDILDKKSTKGAEMNSKIKDNKHTLEQISYEVINNYNLDLPAFWV